MKLQSLVDRGVVSDRVARQFAGPEEASTRRDPKLAKYLGSTSRDGKALDNDDGGVQRGNAGAVSRGHIDDAKPRKGSGFTNPESDYGPDNFGAKHIDAGTTRRRDPQQARMKQDRDKLMRIDARRDGNVPSVERARRSSANEYHEDSWYGDPAGRQR